MCYGNESLKRNPHNIRGKKRSAIITALAINHFAKKKMIIS